MSCTVLIRILEAGNPSLARLPLICATTAEQVALQTYSLTHVSFGIICSIQVRS